MLKSLQSNNSAHNKVLWLVVMLIFEYFQRNPYPMLASKIQDPNVIVDRMRRRHFNCIKFERKNLKEESQF